MNIFVWLTEAGLQDFVEFIFVEFIVTFAGWQSLKPYHVHLEKMMII